MTARKVELKIVARDEDGNITRPTPGEQLAAILRAGFESFGNMQEPEQVKTITGLAEWLQKNPKFSAALGIAVNARAAQAAAPAPPWAPVEWQRMTFGPDGTPEGRLILRGNTLEDLGNMGVETVMSEDGESVTFKCRFMG